MAKIYVILEGGLCQGVCTDSPALQGVEFVVVDYDIEGSDDTTEVDQGDGTSQSACVWSDTIGRAIIKIEED